MKFTLLKFGKHSYHFHIEREYKYHRKLVSAGPDCHPAWLLSALHLRSVSLPFDWQLTASRFGIRYLVNNINECFAKQITNLKHNDKGNLISTAYEYSEFLHFEDLDKNPDTARKLLRRSSRLMDILKKDKVSFLYSAKCEDFTDFEICDEFVESVNQFEASEHCKDHEILIYLVQRHDVSVDMEKCEYLIRELNKLARARAAIYQRDYDGMDYWENKREYLKILELVGVKPKKGNFRFLINPTNIFV